VSSSTGTSTIVPDAAALDLTSSPAFENTVEQCVDATESLDFAEAKAWKRDGAGRALVGCFPVYSPVEIYHAAGALPVGLLGGGNRIEIAHADARFQSFVCSIVKSTLELGMTGKLDDFDGLVFHSICDPARNLASVYARNFPNMKVEYIHFPQRIGADDATTYLAAEYARVAEWAAELTGHTPSADDLKDSMALYDAIRANIRTLYAIRAAGPHVLSTRELYALVRYGYVVPPQRHLRVLERAIEQLGARGGKPKDRARVVIVGSFCEQPPLDLIASIESAGCYIMDDDFLLGRRFFTEDVGSGPGSPLERLAEAYVRRSVDASVKHDLGHSKAQALVARAHAHRADAVVVLAPKFCEPALFDYVLYRQALQEAHVPHVFLEYEEKMWLFDKIKTEIETFVESLLFA
jgi:benzoyl-CoA reductase subunit C